ncbi:MAG: hypothetical protein JW720_07110 [Sedimentisphaerales bacterium]|nr:hypothetical protein [Sedimentisphaerales bacterium]
MVYTLPHFMGYRFGLFNFATKTTGGFVDFDFYRLEDKIAGSKQVIVFPEIPALRKSS